MASFSGADITVGQARHALKANIRAVANAAVQVDEPPQTYDNTIHECRDFLALLKPYGRGTTLGEVSQRSEQEVARGVDERTTKVEVGGASVGLVGVGLALATAGGPVGVALALTGSAVVIASAKVRQHGEKAGDYREVVRQELPKVSAFAAALEGHSSSLGTPEAAGSGWILAKS